MTITNRRHGRPLFDALGGRARPGTPRPRRGARAARARGTVGLRLLAPIALVALATGGGAGAASTTSTVQAVSNSALKTKLLVNATGFTLYHMTSEKKGAIGCTGGCRKAWPPLLVSGAKKPVAGLGVTASKLGTIKRPDGGVQVTYNGYALYLFGGDKKAGQTNGQGVGSVWYAMTPVGTVTRAKPASSSTGSGSTAGTSGKSGSGSGSSSGGTGTTPSGGGTSTTSNSPPGTDTADNCPAGQGIPQGTYAGDGDEDNIGMPTDGDGCL